MILEGATLRVAVNPEAGGSVVSLRHLPSGAEVLARTPWEAAPATNEPAPDEASWLARWPGGWPVMFPNAGDAGGGHGFHGEGSVAPWEATWDGPALLLSRRFRAVPASLTRRLLLDGDRLVVEEEAVADAPCEVIWGQHVTLGSSLLAGPVRVSTSATRAAACAHYAPAASPLQPGAVGAWPLLPGREGPVDLSRPTEGLAMLACLHDLGPAPWAEVAREDGSLAVRLDWSADPWPLAWLWVETGGTREAPWLGRGRCLGVEPCTTWPATGRARAPSEGGRLLPLRPGEARRGRIALRVFQP